MSRLRNIWNTLRARSPNRKYIVYVCKTYVDNKDTGYKGACNLKFMDKDHALKHAERFNHRVKEEVFWGI